MRYLILPLVFLFAACAPAPSSSSGGSSGGASYTSYDNRSGFLDLYVDTDSNRILVKLPDGEAGEPLVSFIHAARLSAGLGSNPVGLDRGWGESGRVVDVMRRGDKVVLVERNLSYRAKTDNPLETRAVAESFAPSFLATLPIIDKSGDGIVVDMTAFLTSDFLNLVQYLKDADQGAFTVAKDRTFIDTTKSFAFEDNVEIDVFFTLSSADPGREVATTAANGRDATLVTHHSFVRLPEPGYTPLIADPRSGAIEEVHYNYSAELSDNIETRFARRYRLERDADGNVVDPIVFYIDGGAPEPIRSALVDGARWWEDAFAAAGWPDGYRVEILPEDAHPLDIRYNTVQWVHRQTRGWSYGGGVSDPRTGEMLKGHVNLGSLRVRQDRMIFEGLLGAGKTDSGDPDDPVELALARIRQLSAHEVGHALGFAHNFAASTDDKASVMDYPAMDVRLVDGQLNVSNAYGVGIGEWDKVTAKWLYGENTDAERDAILDDAFDSGLSYIADRDGRGVGTAHPEGSVWDNGADPVASLKNVMAVRAYALERFGPDNLPSGRPQSDLNAAIVPIYLYHRYQVVAASKLVGGMSFNYGDAGAAEIVSPARQRAALEAILDTVDPSTLDISDATLSHLTPTLGSFSFADSDRELFRKTAYPAFDTVAAAGTAAEVSFDALLHPQRAARLVEFHRRDRANLGLEDMLSTINRRVLRQRGQGRTAAIADVVRARYAYGLMDLADSESGPAVKAETRAALRDLEQALRNGSTTDRWLADEIENYRNRPAVARKPVVPAKQLPPGGPIGSD
jgi:hypothetical protein